MLLFSTKTEAQLSPCPIDRFEFEIEKVPPASPWRVNSTVGAPGAFHAFYRVKLKTRAGQPPFPQSFFFNYLQFNGTINLNNFTSRINVQKTLEYSNAYYLQFLDTNPLTLENGEINWAIGTSGNCEPGIGVQLTLPMGQTSVTLFTICVEAVPGDIIHWPTSAASTWQCEPPGITCNGPVVVTATGNTTLIDFPGPSPGIGLKQVFYEYAYDIGLQSPTVRVGFAHPLAASGYYAKADGFIHIVPEMTGASLNLVPHTFAPNGPAFTRLESRKNADGSFDIYFSFEEYPKDPDDPPLDPSQDLYLFAIQLDGIYNLSQGGNLNCSLTAGRWVSGSLANNNVTYQLFSSPTPTVVNIPGHEPCTNNFKITGSTYEAQGCSSGIRFTLNHDNPTPMSLQLLKLEFRYQTSLTGSALAGTPTTDLPDAANSGSFVSLSNGSTWFYIYEKQGTFADPILIENGMYVDVPFDITHSCISYRVTRGEADPTPGAGNGNSYCALEVELGDDLCDPEVVGSVFLPNFATAPYYRVSLKDYDSPYDLDEDTYCEPSFSFCPDQSKAPFFLEVETNQDYLDDYLCIETDNNGNYLNVGVTSYDLVLMEKHLLGIQLFTNVYQRFAANADNDFQLERIDDIDNFRKLILGDLGPNDPPFSTTPSWWYIRESLLIPTPSNRFEVPNVGLSTANTEDVPLNGQGNYGNFHAVKLGDVNYTCNCNSLRPGKETAPVQFKISASELRVEGNFVYVPIYADAPFDLEAAQLGIRFDPALFSLSEVLPNPEMPIFPYHFGLTNKDLGELRFAWSLDQDLAPLPGKELLFTIKFELKPRATMPQGPLCWGSDNIMKNLAYPYDGTEHPIRLVWDGKRLDGEPTLSLVVRPNPFEENITDFIYSAKPLTATVQISGNRGTAYGQQTVELHAGDNVVPIQLPASAQPGVYFLALEVDGHRIQRRVVKI